MSRVDREIERRWIVHEIKPDAWNSLSQIIYQGYPSLESGMRSRLTEQNERTEAELMRKTGHGLDRNEQRPSETDLTAGRFVYDGSPYQLKKQRHFVNNWHIDRHIWPLQGLIVAEYEMRNTDMAFDMHPDIIRATEVTNTVSNSVLAYLGRDMRHADTNPERFAEDMKILRRMISAPPKRVCFTGGPCSGKSSVMEILAKRFPGRFQTVPEVATIVIKQLGAPPFPAARHFQNRRYNRAFVSTQKTFEDLALDRALEDGCEAMLMDRGTLDNAAYVAGGIRGLEDACLTTVKAERSRYDVVIYIEMPSREVYERCKDNNKTRYETYEQAQVTGKNTLACWEGHRNLIVAPDAATWDQKVAGIVGRVEEVLAA